jgi:hypothetical protein
VLRIFEKMQEDFAEMLEALDERRQMHRQNQYQPGVDRLTEEIRQATRDATHIAMRKDILMGRWEEDDKKGFCY